VNYLTRLTAPGRKVGAEPVASIFSLAGIEHSVPAASFFQLCQTKTALIHNRRIINIKTTLFIKPNLKIDDANVGRKNWVESRFGMKWQKSRME
jgi:hypothetical protein